MRRGLQISNENMSQVVHFEAEMFKHRLSKELDEIIDPIKKFDRPKFY